MLALSFSRSIGGLSDNGGMIPTEMLTWKSTRDTTFGDSLATVWRRPNQRLLINTAKELINDQLSIQCLSTTSFSLYRRSLRLSTHSPCKRTTTVFSPLETWHEERCARAIMSRFWCVFAIHMSFSFCTFILPYLFDYHHRQ